MMRLFLKRRESKDRADSTLVTFILVFPLFFTFLITMVDTSMYFANRSVVQQIARDGARTIAIYGGNGDATNQSPLEAAYGQPMACTSEEQAKLNNGTAVECSVLKRLMDGAGLTSVEFPDKDGAHPMGTVNCGPYKVNTVGETTFCEVSWIYNGVPGSTMSFVSAKDPRTGESGSYLQNNNTRVTSESEVGMVDTCFVRRDGVAGGCA